MSSGGGYTAPKVATAAAEEGGSSSDEEVPGLKAWLEKREQGEYLGYFTEWCEANGAASLKEVEENFEEIKTEILYSKIDPGRKVRVKVLTGNSKGEYLARVVGADIRRHSKTFGMSIRHLEDDSVETIPFAALAGKEYSIEPVTDDEHKEEGRAVPDEKECDTDFRMANGRLKVDEEVGTGLDLRWVEMGYCVDDIEKTPGQPALEVGNVIVAIGNSLLVGLDEDAVEAKYRENIKDGVKIVVGRPGAALRKASVAEVKDCAKDCLPEDSD